MTVNALQERVQRAIDELVASGRELGVQVAAYVRGELVVDACAGVADPGSGRPVTPDTPFFSFSTGKGMTATAVHVLVERGELDYDLRIADVWPEYAQHGKGGTTLRHALTHAAGVPALPAGVTAEDFTDWTRMCALVAGSEPLWEPGTAHGYHAWTYGWLVGETVRRATGRTLAQVLAEDVAEPLKVPGELFFGVPADQQHRLAVLRDGNWSAALEQISSAVPRLDLVAPPGVRPDAAIGGRPDVLRADVPAVGTMTARAAARMYAALIGEVDGVRLVSPERLAEMTAVAVGGPDWVFGADVERALGYSIEGGGAMFGASGSGGSLAGAAPAHGLALAATKNLLTAGEDDPMEDLRALILEAVA
ncbi:serine hydrolase domain-containing protein [Nonomuraea indica]|uniref:serine hydrolase domain-containing protein n=1 Tax=Nonomuraea indica TaxID=1581193 RepID=UPI000C7D36D9|nr:serine hydrolase domain-containing protein [Nonomuraea indica]